MKQVIIGGRNDAVSATTEYNCLMGGYNWGATAALRTQVIPTGGTLSRLSFELSAAPDPGTTGSYTFTLYVNGSATALVVTIAGDNTTGIDVTHTVNVSAGDYVYLECVDADTPAATPTARWSCVFEGTTANESIILGINYTNNAATLYAPIGGNAVAGTTTEAANVVIIPTDGYLKKLYVRLTNGDAGTSPDAYTYKLRVNSADSNDGSGNPLAVTLVADTTTGNDTAHSIDVTPGMAVCLATIPVETPSNVACYAAYGLVFLADTDGESLILGSSSDGITNSQTEYQYLQTTNGSNTWGTTEVFQGGQAPTGNMVLKKFYVKLSGSPGAGNDYDFTIRGGGGNTTITVNIGETDTTGNDTVHTYSCAAYDDLSIMAVPTSAPTARNAHWGLVCYMAPAGWANIGKINGITSSDIAKIHNIAVADIGKVNGVSV